MSFVDRATGDDKTEAARAILREKAPELLELMAQVGTTNNIHSVEDTCVVAVRTSLPKGEMLPSVDGWFFVFNP